MKTFADYLPTLTAREREIVEAFHLATEAWHDDDNPVTGCPIAEMRYTPTAKEPVTLCEFVARADWYLVSMRGERVCDVLCDYKSGDRVRVTKIEDNER